MQKELMLTRNLQTNNFQILLQKPTTLHELLQTHANNLLTARFVKNYALALKTYVFVFSIAHEQHNWKLRKRINDFVEFQSTMKKRYGAEVPALPIQKETQLNQKNVHEFSQFLFVFFKRIVNLAFYDEDVQHFFDILPQKYGHGIIYGQLQLNKLSGGRYTEATCSRKLRKLFCKCCRNWKRRWFTVTDQGVFYTYKSKSFEIKEMLNFSHDFTVLYGQYETGEDLGITIQSSYRQLKLRTNSLYEFTMFLTAMKIAFGLCPNSQQQRYKSFSPLHRNCETKFYIDGEKYFEDLCNQLLAARKYIYITDWMITPYFLLKRPRELDDHSARFDYVLENAASRGIKVYIILYQQPQIALNNDSKFVEKHLEELHRNIKVLRHPKYIVIPFLWSHHEKIVVIDQRVAFLGGFDVCYGRWDTSEHRLVDDQEIWKGADYCNLRISDIYSPRNFLVSNIESKTQPRMPWHDIGVQIRGLSVHDVARHFAHYWNFVSFQTRFNQRQLLHLSGRQSMAFRSMNFPNKPNKDEIDEQIQNFQMVFAQNTMLQGQFYQHYIDDDTLKIFNIQIPKIPNLDVIKQNLRNYPKRLMTYLKPHEDDEKLLISKVEQLESFGRFTHQILRSASTWSLGLLENNQQKSIYNAYLDVIERSKRFIYIQNQFFICKENLIADAIVKRIEKAYNAQEKFKVLIMLPLLPGFEGNIEDNASSVMRVQLHWEYWTIIRSKKSLYRRLAHISNIDDYIKFYSVRAHGLSRDGEPLTEILYIHSKLIIVDDSVIILGSANINDRSMLGDRDSEIGIIVEDQDRVLTKHNHEVSKAAQKLRMELFKEHFGLTDEQAENYHDQYIWQLIKKRAKRNTEIYREVFGCYPDDNMQTFGDITLVREASNWRKYLERRNEIIGHVVELPLRFLQKQNLALTPKQKEFYVPDINFT